MVTGAFILRRSSPLRPFLNSHVSNILNQNYIQTGWSMTCKKRRGIAFPYRAKATAQIISIFGQISQNSDTLIHLPGLQQLLGFPCMRHSSSLLHATLHRQQLEGVHHRPPPDDSAAAASKLSKLSKLSNPPLYFAAVASRAFASVLRVFSVSST